MICSALQHASPPPLLFHFLVYGEGEGGGRRGVAGEGGFLGKLIGKLNSSLSWQHFFGACSEYISNQRSFIQQRIKHKEAILFIVYKTSEQILNMTTIK